MKCNIVVAEIGSIRYSDDDEVDIIIYDDPAAEKVIGNIVSRSRYQGPREVAVAAVKDKYGQPNSETTDPKYSLLKYIKGNETLTAHISEPRAEIGSYQLKGQVIISVENVALVERLRATTLKTNEQQIKDCERRKAEDAMPKF